MHSTDYQLCDRLLEIEWTINGKSVAKRLAVRQIQIAPLVADLEAWMQADQVNLSRHAPLNQAVDCTLIPIYPAGIGPDR